MSEMKPVALKPCPFCGKGARIHTEHDADGFGVFLSVKCSYCQAQSGSTFSSNPCPETYQQVRDKWNRRPALTDEQVREIAEKWTAEYVDTDLSSIAECIESALREALGMGERG